jgi:hypothetical protein
LRDATLGNGGKMSRKTAAQGSRFKESNKVAKDNAQPR